MGMFQDRMDQRSAQMALDDAAWRMRISHSRGSREAAQMQGDAARERLQGLEARKLQGVQNDAQTLASMRAPEGHAPDLGGTPSIDKDSLGIPGSSAPINSGGAAAPGGLAKLGVQRTGNTYSAAPASALESGSYEPNPNVSYGAPKPLLGMPSFGGSDPTELMSAWAPLDESTMNKYFPSSVPSHAAGGPVYGPPGLDQVPAEMPDGSPARLNNGEYVLPKEYVIGLAKKSLGKKGDMLAPEKLHALGVDLLDGEVAQYTGQQPGAKPAPPLPGQEGMVPAMAGGGPIQEYGRYPYVEGLPPRDLRLPRVITGQDVARRAQDAQLYRETTRNIARTNNTIGAARAAGASAPEFMRTPPLSNNMPIPYEGPVRFARPPAPMAGPAQPPLAVPVSPEDQAFAQRAQAWAQNARAGLEAQSRFVGPPPPGPLAYEQQIAARAQAQRQALLAAHADDLKYRLWQQQMHNQAAYNATQPASGAVTPSRAAAEKRAMEGRGAALRMKPTVSAPMPESGGTTRFSRVAQPMTQGAKAAGERAAARAAFLRPQPIGVGGAALFAGPQLMLHPTDTVSGKTEAEHMIAQAQAAGVPPPDWAVATVNAPAPRQHPIERAFESAMQTVDYMNPTTLGPVRALFDRGLAPRQPPPPPNGNFEVRAPGPLEQLTGNSADSVQAMENVTNARAWGERTRAQLAADQTARAKAYYASTGLQSAHPDDVAYMEGLRQAFEAGGPNRNYAAQINRGGRRSTTQPAPREIPWQQQATQAATELAQRWGISRGAAAQYVLKEMLDAYKPQTPNLDATKFQYQQGRDKISDARWAYEQQAAAEQARMQQAGNAYRNTVMVDQVDEGTGQVIQVPYFFGPTGLVPLLGGNMGNTLPQGYKLPK